jgi:hypothetical protein
VTEFQEREGRHLLTWQVDRELPPEVKKIMQEELMAMLERMRVLAPQYSFWASMECWGQSGRLRTSTVISHDPTQPSGST